MKKILILLAFVPFLLNGQSLIDLSKYHDDTRKDEMIDSNLVMLTTGIYTLPSLSSDGLVILDSVLVVTNGDGRVGINKLSPEVGLDVVVNDDTYSGVRVRNISSGTLASGGISLRNDNNRLVGLGISGSNNAFFGSDVGVLFNQGYAEQQFIVDGNFGFSWWTDVTDTHLFIWTKKMELKANGILNIANTPTYADNTAALAGGLVAGDVYRTATGDLKIVY